MASLLIEVIGRRSRSQPHDPWLFWPRGLDWSFLTWGQAAARLEALGGDLAPAAGWPVAFPWSSRGEDWLLDLALREAGAVAVPILATDSVGLVAAAHRLRASVICEGCRPCFVHDGAPPRSADGGWLVHGGGGRERWDDARVADVVQRLQKELGPAARRDVALVHGSPEEASVRVVLSWATSSGAAVLLEPSRDRLVETFRWARPTVLLAGTAAVAELQARMAATESRRFGARRLDRLRGRLRALVATDAAALASIERRLWDAAGVRVVQA